MGKRSVKENKNLYQLSREAAGLSREKASELLEGISADRLEKLENETLLPHPEEILMMEKAYRTPGLCNAYCARECAIGRVYVPQIPQQELSQITLQVLASLNELQKEKDRLIEISVDGKIDAAEKSDFERIRGELAEMTVAAGALELWLRRSIAEQEKKVQP